MASVFEYFSKEVSTKTLIPELGISNNTFSLQLESKKYFSIERNAIATVGNKLAVTIKEPFDLTNLEQTSYLNRSIHLFQENLARIKAIDLKIMASVTAGVVSSALSFFPLVSMLGLIGWGAALYYINQRARAYAEYHESLSLLVGNCNWALGGRLTTDRTCSAFELTSADIIRKMMVNLYPVLNKTQIEHLIADDIQGIFVEELNQYNQKVEPSINNRFFTRPDEQLVLAKQSSEFKRCLYGLNKGSFIDFLDALASALPDLYRVVRRVAQEALFKCKSWISTPQPAEEPALQTTPQS